MVNQFLAELFGTALLILLGDGVVANIALKKTKGNGADLIVVTVGWAIAVAIPVYIFSRVSGAVFNPAVTIALGITGGLTWSQVIMFCIAQFIGAFIGAVLVYLTYYTHFESTEDHDAKLGTFCTIPAIRNYKWNFFTEFIGTFVLMFGILGPTGYAINPARDFSPRLAHFLLPMKNKGGSDWAYAWIPIVGPILGAIAGAMVYTNIF